MADQDEYRIRVNIDPSQAVSGANAVTAAEQEMSAATTEAGESAVKSGATAQEMTELLREHQQQLMKNVFAVHRLAEGFKDIQMGGRMGAQGIMDISEAAQYALAPELAIYVVIAQVVGMLAIMTTSHRHAGEEAKAHADQEKEAQEAIEKTADSIIKFADAATKTHLEVLTSQLKDYLDVQKQLIEQQKQWDENADARLGYLQKETEATQKLALAQLEHQKQLDLNAATSDEQRAVIEADYKRREIAAKGGDSQQANMAEQTLLAQQKQEDDTERALYLEVNRANDAVVKKYKDDADAKAQRAIGDGFSPDEAGSFKDAIKTQEQVFNKAFKDAANVQVQTFWDRVAARHVEEGIGTDAEKQHLEVRRRAIVDAQTNMTDQSTKLADLREAEAARDLFNTNIKGWQADIDTNSKAINALVNKLDEIYSKQRVLSTESKTEAVTTSTEQLANNADADKAQAGMHYKTWQDTIKQDEVAHRQQTEAARAGAAAKKADEKQDEENIKLATQTIEKSGSGTAIAQLQGVLAAHLATLQELPVLMQIIAQSHLRLETRVDDVSATVERLRHR